VSDTLATAIAGIIVAGVVGPTMAYRFQRRQWRRDRRADAYVEALQQLGERKAWRNPLLNDPDAHPSDRDWRSAEAALRLFGSATARTTAEEALKAHRAYVVAAFERRSEISADIRPLSVTPMELSNLADAADAAFDKFVSVVESDLGL
jgi:hypothetical protein